MLYEVKMELMNEEEGEEEEIDFTEEEEEEETGLLERFFLSTARAEEDAAEEYDVVEEEIIEGDLSILPEWKLPLDFTPAPAPKKENYTEDSYEDDTIMVKMEHRDFDEETKIHIAWIRIADASQLRTGVYKPNKLGSSNALPVTTISRKYNPVIAINGDNFTNDVPKKTYIYRMGQTVRAKGNKLKDILIIDDQGDFHLYIKSQGLETGKTKNNKVVWMKPEEWEKANGRKMSNAFTFGPALVKDGEIVETDTEYSYNPGGREPRSAIGQVGPLSYVIVIVEVNNRDGRSGMSHGKLAELMHELGCQQAYNLDGGNSAEMVFGEQVYKGMPGGSERGITDIIYFATAMPE